MSQVCCDCGSSIDHRRIRCYECAYAHHKVETSRQRRERTTIEQGWGESRPCTDCGVMFVQDHRFSAGPRRKRCDTCRAYKPKPLKVCARCHVQMVSAPRRTYCDPCLPLLTAERKALAVQENRLRREALLVPCRVCNVTRTKDGIPCTKCGHAARRRQASRLRDFRERLFTSIVHSPVDVEVILALLDSSCEYCGSTDEITIEHRIPLIKGGSHTLDNLTSACKSCNSSKQDKTLEEWCPSRTQIMA